MSNQPQYASIDFQTPVGRLVSGNLSVASDKGYNGVVREKPQYFFALAIPKADPSSIPLLQKLQNHAWTSYQAVQGNAVLQKMQAGPIGAVFPAGIQAPFAWKVEDGDSPEFAGREGWAGCWILKFAGTFAPNVCNAQNQQLNPASIQLGSYAQVAGSSSINGKMDHTAGIYLNYRFVRVVAPADGVNVPIITTGPTAAQAFGDSGYTGPLPAGVGQPAPGGMPQPPAPAYAPQQPAYAPPQGQNYASQQPAYAPPAPPQQPGVGNYTPPPAPAPSVPAGAAPAHGYPAAAPMSPQSYPATAYPSNPTPGTYPGVQPHHGVLQPPAPGAPPAHGMPPVPGQYPQQ